MDIRSLTTKWKFEVEHEKLNKLESQIDGIKNRLDTIIGFEAAKALFELAEKFAKVAENIHIGAEAAGLGAEEFQKLTLAGKMFGVETHEMELGLRRLSKSLYDARNGSKEANQAFLNAGFTSEQIAGFRTSKDALLALSDRFRGMSDPIKKQALATELLGRGSLHLIGFLNQGSSKIRTTGDEFQRLGAVLSGPQVHALVEAEHSFQKLWAVITGISQQIAANVAPAITLLVNDFISLFGANQKVIGQGLDTWLYGVGYAAGFLYSIFKNLFEFLKEKNIFALIQPTIQLIGEGLKLIVDAIKYIYEKGEKIAKMEFFQGIQDRLGQSLFENSGQGGIGGAISRIGDIVTYGSQSGTFAPQVTVNVGAGVSAQDGKVIGDHVQSKIKDLRDQHMRETMREVRGSVKH